MTLKITPSSLFISPFSTSHSLHFSSSSSVSGPLVITLSMGGHETCRRSWAASRSIGKGKSLTCISGFILKGAGRQHVRANEKARRGNPPGLLRNSRGYLFLLESRFIVKRVFSPASFPSPRHLAVKLSASSCCIRRLQHVFDQLESDVVMAGTGTSLRLRSGDPVVPAIHALAFTRKPWMRGTSPRMTWIQTSKTSSNRNDRVQKKLQTKCPVRI